VSSEPRFRGTGEIGERRWDEVARRMISGRIVTVRALDASIAAVPGRHRPRSPMRRRWPSYGAGAAGPAQAADPGSGLTARLFAPALRLLESRSPNPHLDQDEAHCNAGRNGTILPNTCRSGLGRIGCVEWQRRTLRGSGQDAAAAQAFSKRRWAMFDPPWSPGRGAFPRSLNPPRA